MKVSVIGAGSVGTIALLELLRNRKKCNIESIVLSYDPNIPKVEVGEAVSWVVERALIEVLGPDKTEQVLNTCDVTRRKCSRFYWKEATGKDFDITYGIGGIHFNSRVFSETVLEAIDEKYDIVEIKQENVSAKNLKKSFDIVIDCSGRPSEDELKKDYIQPEFDTVNSVLLYPQYENYNEDFTSAYWHGNGWTFGVPLTSRKAFGYLYNRKITTKEEAIEDFSKRHSFIEVDKLKSISWDFYYKKKVLDDRILYLGNKSYFFEPAQGLPIHFYVDILVYFLNIYSKMSSYTEEFEFTCNGMYITQIRKVLDLIAYNYTGDIVPKTEFWETTKEKALNHLRSSYDFNEWLENCIETQKIQGYCFHKPYIMEAYTAGYNVNLHNFL